MKLRRHVAHRRHPREAVRAHWTDAAGGNERTAPRVFAPQADPRGHVHHTARSTFRWWRRQLLGAPQPISAAPVDRSVAERVAAAYTEVAQEDRKTAHCHRREAQEYLRTLGVAAAWECFFSVLAHSVTALWAVLTVVFFYQRQVSPSAAAIAGLAVLGAALLPRFPMAGSRRPVIGRIAGLGVLALLTPTVGMRLDVFDHYGIPHPAAAILG